MLDILLAWLGPATCPWCDRWDGSETFWDKWVINKMPLWLFKKLSPYDEWVGRVGGGIHRKEHI